ncbi:hypothetical protein PDIG_30940 [Penicillium digitatum PHI26]|uniref:Uncharacterized protein n=2 Tax=Penicillium digitatum TaxID=36651 RepID=K9GN88_PEND2|nr:hypothetical protein PDIP_50520 [Penicillium digitatum Pd1]EKV12867.1 hypothetical protein PDIP_50520 [Penicillium digitatum Pd1]EKV14641.1 hypothetical protein PDIG_30940 [Penicillium digitatum PHI26]
MHISHSVALHLAASACAATFFGFGVNAILCCMLYVQTMEHALSFFEFQPPNDLVYQHMVHILMARSEIRDIFMGGLPHMRLRISAPVQPWAGSRLPLATLDFQMGMFVGLMATDSGITGDTHQ